jgi:hypothetical protein
MVKDEHMYKNRTDNINLNCMTESFIVFLVRDKEPKVNKKVEQKKLQAINVSKRFVGIFFYSLIQLKT